MSILVELKIPFDVVCCSCDCVLSRNTKVRARKLKENNLNLVKFPCPECHLMLSLVCEQRNCYEVYQGCKISVERSDILMADSEGPLSVSDLDLSKIRRE